MGIIVFSKIHSDFYFDGGYMEKYIPKSAGFRWSPTRKVFKTEKSVCVRRLIEYCPEETIEMLIKLEDSELNHSLDFKKKQIEINSVPFSINGDFLTFRFFYCDVAIAFIANNGEDFRTKSIGALIEIINKLNFSESDFEKIQLSVRVSEINHGIDSCWNAVFVKYGNFGKYKMENYIPVNFDDRDRSTKISIELLLYRSDWVFNLAKNAHTYCVSISNLSDWSSK